MVKIIKLNETFFISIVVHLVIIVVLSLAINTNIFEASSPIIVTIESPDVLPTEGMDDVLDSPKTPIEAKKNTKEEEKIVKAEKPIAKKASEVDEEKPIKKESTTKGVTPIPDKNVKSSETENPIGEKTDSTAKTDTSAEDVKKRTEMDEAKKALEGVDDILDKDPEIGDPSKKPTKGEGTKRTTVKNRGLLNYESVMNDIQREIQEKYGSRGIGYSITVKIVFAPNGRVISVEPLEKSLNSGVDRIFIKNLRKLKAKPISGEYNEFATKEFNVNPK